MSFPMTGPVFDAIKKRLESKNVNQTITGAVVNGVQYWLSQGEMVPRVARPYAECQPIEESPGTGGVKRTNKGEYVTVGLQFNVFDNTIELLTERDMPLMDSVLRYGDQNAIPLLDGRLIKLFPKPWRWFFVDQYWQGIMEYDAWVSRSAQYTQAP